MPGDGNLYIKFYYIAFGDCTIIKTPNGKNIMIDGGGEEFGEDEAIIGEIADDIHDFITCPMDPEGEEPESGKIDVLILTHPHDDHYNKIRYLLESTPIETVYFAGPWNEFNDFNFLCWLHGCSFAPRMDAIANIADDVYPLTINYGQTAPYLILSSEDGGGCSLTALAANVGTDINANSIVTLIEFDDNKILVPGDATEETETFMLSVEAIAEKLANMEIIRVPHHGSDTSSSEDFLDAMNLGRPKSKAIISCSYENRYCLPRKTIIDRYIDRLPRESANHWISYYGGRDREMETNSNIFETEYAGFCYSYVFNGTRN